MRFLWLASLSVVLLGCESPVGVDVQGLSPLPSLNPAEFKNMHLGVPVEYWEMRVAPFYRQQHVSWLDVSFDRARRAGMDSALLQQLEATWPSTMIAHYLCVIGEQCVPYIAAVNGQNITIYDSLDELRTFLGEIDTAEEAALVVHAQGYGWNSDVRQNGIRAVSDGWDIVVIEGVSSCKPYREDQIVLHVARDATVTEIARALWKKDDKMCVIS